MTPHSPFFSPLVQCEMDQQQLVAEIEKSFENKQIYHALGTQALLSINPGKVDKDTVDNSILKTILEASEDPTRNEQVIIVTGISGSGKTTAIRRCLELRSGSFNDNEHCKRVWGKFVAQFIVMESFGNAVTRNNPDSSRMGRMIKIIEPGLDSMQIQSYPLMHEDARLSLFSNAPSSATERSFHALHQVLAGFPDHPALAKFPDIIQSHPTLPGDRIGFEQTDSAMKSLHGPESSDRHWNALIGIILILTASSFTDPKIAFAHTTLLGMNPDFDLATDLARWKKSTGSTEQEELVLWARCLYRKLFRLATASETNKPSSVSRMLVFIDVCGTEDLPRNRLQQLLINVWNDKLEASYRVLALEANTGSQERPSESPMDTLLDLIGPTDSDQMMENKLTSHFVGPSPIGGIHFTRQNHTLTISHASRPAMKYDWKSFLSDKVDGVRQDRLEAMHSLDDTNGQPSKRLRASRNAIEVARSNWKMVAEMIRGKTLFIKCVKSNPTLQPWTFDTSVVQKQLEQLAILETIRFSKSLPGQYAQTEGDFIATYTELCAHATTTPGIDDIIQQSGLEGESTLHHVVRGGYVFYSEDLSNALERKLKDVRDRKLALAEEQERARVLALEKERERVLAEEAEKEAKERDLAQREQSILKQEEEKGSLDAEEGRIRALAREYELARVLKDENERARLSVEEAKQKARKVEEHVKRIDLSDNNLAMEQEVEAKQILSEEKNTSARRQRDTRVTKQNIKVNAPAHKNINARSISQPLNLDYNIPRPNLSQRRIVVSDSHPYRATSGPAERRPRANLNSILAELEVHLSILTDSTDTSAILFIQRDVATFIATACERAVFLSGYDDGSRVIRACHRTLYQHAVNPGAVHVSASVWCIWYTMRDRYLLLAAICDQQTALGIAGLREIGYECDEGQFDKLRDGIWSILADDVEMMAQEVIDLMWRENSA